MSEELSPIQKYNNSHTALPQYKSWIPRAAANWEKARKIQLLYRCIIFARSSVYSHLIDDQFSALQAKKLNNSKKRTFQNSWYKSAFDLLISLINFYLAFTIPFRLAFYKNHRVDKLYIHDLILDSILFISILLNFNKPPRPDHYLYNVTSKHVYLHHFLSLLLYSDILSIIPLYMLDNRWYYLKLGRILRVNSIFSWVLSSKLPKIVMKKVGRSMYQRILAIFHVLQYSNAIMIICHCVACLWYIIPNQLSTPNSETWLGSDWEQYSVTDNYVRSLYWTAVTFSSVGYGDITGKTTPEYLYSMFVEFLGIMCFAFCMGSLTNALSEYNTKQEQVKFRENELNRWLIFIEDNVTNTDAQTEINEKIVKYFNQKWLCDPRSLNNHEDYMMMLPPGLATKLASRLFGHRLNLFASFFKLFPEPVQFLISGQLSSDSFEPKSEIIKSNSRNNKIYFVAAGSVAVGFVDKGFALMLGVSSFFGEDSAIFEDFSMLSFVARTEVCVHFIEYPVLRKILKKKKIDILPLAKLAFNRAKYFDVVNKFKYGSGSYVSEEEVKEFCGKFGFVNLDFDMETEDEFWERGKELKGFLEKKENVLGEFGKKINDEAKKQADRLGKEVQEMQMRYEKEIEAILKGMERVKENILSDD